MYKIRDTDQKEHGPLIAPVIKQWITMGRADKDTMVLKTGENEWRPLSSCTEFHDALGIPRETSSGSSSRGKSRSSSRSSESVTAEHSPSGSISGMAVASLVLGIFGLLGITALAGLILGLVAQSRINQSGGFLKGTGVAVAGMILSGTMLLLSIPVLGGIFMPNLSQAAAKENESLCLIHAEELSRALLQMAQSSQNQFPAETNWCDRLLAYSPQLKTQRAFTCPTKPKVESGYGFNINLAGQSIPEVSPDTVMLFESNQGWNGAGGPSAMADSRHGMFVVVAFADGTVDRVPAYQIPQLKWTP